MGTPSRPTLLEGVLLLSLFAGLTAINPWGQGHEAIWNAPREAGMAAFVLLTLLGVLVRKSRLPHLGSEGLALLASLGFLLSGIAATLLSPQPIWSFTGYSSVGDGLRFWALGVAFAWATYLALKTGLVSPKRLAATLFLGLGLHTLAIFPQVWNWKLDYTHTQGQTYVRCFDEAKTQCQENPKATASGVHQGQMPIGLTSHRGHAAGVLALLGLFVAGHYLGKPSRRLLFLFALGSLALWFTQTRGGWLALWVPLLSLGLFWARPMRTPGVWRLLAAGALTFGVYWGATHLHLVEFRRFFAELGADFAEANAFSSGRLELWQKALEALPLRPLLGWGFDGFARAYPYAVDWNGKEQDQMPIALTPPVRVIQGEDRLIYLEDAKGLRLLAPSPYAKAHNLVLDLILSVGILGGLAYLLWLGLTLGQASWDRLPWVLVLVGYILYGLTWYDSVHVTPIALLALGAFWVRDETWQKA
ncbi:MULTISPECIES: O-antigen ligase family protein [Thermus]|uniref:O-antigen ligase family protein n=1 Tax=Thermus TaxID=270 RepID=UPI001FAA49AE|nr:MULTISPECIES: O-antigen ligase family protein [Thermus]